MSASKEFVPVVSGTTYDFSATSMANHPAADDHLLRRKLVNIRLREFARSRASTHRFLLMGPVVVCACQVAAQEPSAKGSVHRVNEVSSRQTVPVGAAADQTILGVQPMSELRLRRGDVVLSSGVESSGERVVR